MAARYQSRSLRATDQIHTSVFEAEVDGDICEGSVIGLISKDGRCRLANLDAAKCWVGTGAMSSSEDTE